MHKSLYLAVVASMLTAMPAVASQPFVFYNQHTNMCLEPQNDSTLEGTPVVLQPCNSSGGQQWIYYGAGLQSFLNAKTGLCLDARGGAANHTPVQQWPCNTISNEKWEVDAPIKGTQDRSVHSHVAGSSTFCLDIPGAQATVGLNVQIFGCNQSVAQLWQLKPAENVFVPDVQATDNLLAAENTLTLYGFKSEVTNLTGCFAGKAAIVQEPQPGTFAAFNSTVTLKVYACTKPG